MASRELTTLRAVPATGGKLRARAPQCYSLTTMVQRPRRKTFSGGQKSLIRRGGSLVGSSTTDTGNFDHGRRLLRGDARSRLRCLIAFHLIT
jgi:hypothetical protein